MTSIAIGIIAFLAGLIYTITAAIQDLRQDVSMGPGPRDIIIIAISLIIFLVALGYGVSHG